MSYQAKATKKAVSIPVGLAMGLGISWAVTILLTVIFAFLMLTEKIKITMLSPTAVGIVMFASFAGAMTAAKKIDAHRLMICLASGGVYYISLVCCNALFFDGAYQGLIPALLLLIGSCLLAGVLGMRQKEQKFKGRKWHYKA